MKEKLLFWNQYGFEMDVFDKYRDSVTRSNRVAIKVFSSLVLVITIVIIIFGLITHQPLAGAVFCGISLIAGIYGMRITFREESTRNKILTAGYFLCIATYMLSIYGSYSLRTDVFWVGTLVAVGCYIFDYAWRVGILQIAGYIAMRIIWTLTGMSVDPTRLVFSTLYLVISLVTFYTLNRTRVTLIINREESQTKADTDLLTGLTMRTAAQEEIIEHLKTDEHGVMLLLDLDRFKSVNDRLGHQMGDKVLIEVAADLKKMFRNSDVLSRLGGDEFVVYMKSVPEKEWALQRASQVVREVRRWVGNGTTNIQVTASVGIVMTDMVERNYDALYRAADIAMYSAKSQGGNKALFYTPEMLEHAREREDARHLTSEVVREGTEDLR